MPLVLQAPSAYIVNTASINGFWASGGFLMPFSDYSAAKYAVKGFTEALINDMRLNAPHVRVAVVMPGRIATGIGMNTKKEFAGKGSAGMLGDAQGVKSLRRRQGERVREMQRGGDPQFGILEAKGMGGMFERSLDEIPDEKLESSMERGAQRFRDMAAAGQGGTTAEDAAATILLGVRGDEWRILIGPDALAIDREVREDPAHAYDSTFGEDLFPTAGQPYRKGLWDAYRPGELKSKL